MWNEIDLGLPAVTPLPPVPESAHRRIADQFSIEPRQVWCGSVEDFISQLPAGRIALSRPCAPEITECIVASGRKYVDTGRDYAFRIHPQGWRFAVALEKIQTAWVMLPNEPLGIVPNPSRLDEAADANLLVIIDGRYDLRPFRKDLEWPVSNMVWLRSTDLASGHPTRGIVALMSPSCKLQLSSSTTAVAQAHARWVQSSGMHHRVAQWSSEMERATQQPTNRHGPLTAGYWKTVAGVESDRIDESMLDSPNDVKWRLTTSTDWTWRDGVRLSVCTNAGDRID